MNTDNIQHVIALIKSKPAEKFIMGEFFADWNGLQNEEIIDCKSAMCVAGWTLVACRPQALPTILAHEIESYAAIALGLTREQQQDLFYMNNVPCQSLLDLGAHDPDAESDGIYHKRILPTFDTFPAELRRQAAINVLTILLEVGQVHWLPAIISAHASYHRGELTHEMPKLQQEDGTN